MARKRDTSSSSSKERAPRKRMGEIDYKNGQHLRRYVSEKGQIRSRRVTGACRKHQRQLAVAIKRAREMALLPYSTG
jgi:small subunit ribosomal protein S18